MLLAHMCADDLQEGDGELAALFEIVRQRGELDGIDLRGRIRDGIEDIGRSLLVERQLTDDAVARGEPQRERSPSAYVLQNADLSGTYDIKIFGGIPFVEEILIGSQEDVPPWDAIKLGNGVVHAISPFRIQAHSFCFFSSMSLY